MSHHMVITYDEGALGRRYRAEVEFADGARLQRSVVITPHDMEIEGRAQRAVTWHFKCDFRRHLTDCDDVVDAAIAALLEFDPGAFS